MAADVRGTSAPAHGEGLGLHRKGAGSDAIFQAPHPLTPAPVPRGEGIPLLRLLLQRCDAAGAVEGGAVEPARVDPGDDRLAAALRGVEVEIEDAGDTG